MAAAEAAQMLPYLGGGGGGASAASAAAAVARQKRQGHISMENIQNIVVRVGFENQHVGIFSSYET